MLQDRAQRRGAVDAPPGGGGKQVAASALDVRQNRMRPTAGARPREQPSAVLHSVADQRHRAVREAGEDDVTHLAWLCWLALPQYLELHVLRENVQRSR